MRARSSAAERRPDVPEIAGSIPAARTDVVFFQRPRNPGSQSGNTGSIPVHDTHWRLRLLTDQDLRLRISGWWFESTRSHDSGRDLGSGWPPNPTSGVRFLDDPPAASRSPGGDVGLIRRTCRVRSPGLLRRNARCGSTWLERAVRDRETGGSNPLTSTMASSSPGGDRSPTNCTCRVRFPGSLRGRAFR